MSFVRSIARRIRRLGRAWRHRENLHCKGPVELRLAGTVDGQLYLGELYGLWTRAPSFVSVGAGGAIHVDGRAYFYGDNILRVEPGATLSIGDETRINTQTVLNVKRRVAIGSHCVIAQGVHIRDNDGHQLDGVEGIAPVCIEDHVWIGYHAMILKGVTIGMGAVIAAGAVVVQDVPGGTLVGGNPARVLRSGVRWEP